jgi:hypothetical protein
LLITTLPFLGQVPCGVDLSRLETHVYVLAADSMAGRMTGEAGQKMAADYIVREFRTAGVKPFLCDTGYFQTFALYKSTPSSMVFLGPRASVKVPVVGHAPDGLHAGCSLLYPDPVSPLAKAIYDNPEAFVVIPSTGIKKASRAIARKYDEGGRQFIVVAEGSGWDFLMLQESMPGREYSLQSKPPKGKLSRLTRKADSALVVVMRPLSWQRLLAIA